jgi:hypothetical protein
VWGGRSVDVEATLRQSYELHQKRDGVVAGEAAWLKRRGVDMVLTDSPPVPCAAARAAGR